MNKKSSNSHVLYTDHYEFTMLDSLVKSDQAEKKSVFEIFVREIPQGRPFGVLAGTERVLAGLADFTFNGTHLSFLRSQNIISAITRDWLADFRFTGNITGYREGEIYFPFSPVLTVEAQLGEALILETFILSILNSDSAIASAANRIVEAASGRFVMEAGSRRISPESAVNAARAAYIGGVDVTSNLEAGRRWGIPTAGTASHAFTLAFGSEEEAFENQAKYLGEDSIFLVDTYNIEQGIRNAVNATNANLGGIRIDSGNLGVEAQISRKLLDDLGARQAKIMVSGDLDEYRIKDLITEPIDAFESGHKLVTGSGSGSAGFVYKLVEIEDSDPLIGMRPVAKNTSGKKSKGGRKLAKRKLDLAGIAIEESLFLDACNERIRTTGNFRDLQYLFVDEGVISGRFNIEDARNQLAKVLSEIPKEIRLRSGSHPAVTAVLYDGVEAIG